MKHYRNQEALSWVEISWVGNLNIPATAKAALFGTVLGKSFSGIMLLTPAVAHSRANSIEPSFFVQLSSNVHVLKNDQQTNSVPGSLYA
jgi:hypothetical protein